MSDKPIVVDKAVIRQGYRILRRQAPQHLTGLLDAYEQSHLDLIDNYREAKQMVTAADKNLRTLMDQYGTYSTQSTP